jgi:hypothetical protein
MYELQSVIVGRGPAAVLSREDGSTETLLPTGSVVIRRADGSLFGSSAVEAPVEVTL